MATLEKIRSKGVFLLVVVGLALFAFVIGDFLNSGSTFFRLSQENIAKINGKKVDIQEYQAAVEQLTEVYKIEYGMPSIDEAMNAQIRQTVWDSYLNNSLLETEAEKIGLVVSKNEMLDLTTGNNPSQLVLGRRIFANPETGIFDKSRMTQILSQLKTEPSDPEQQEQYLQLRNYWMYFENLIKTGRLEEKYQTLLSKAINVNSIEAKLAYEAKKNTVDVLYVMQPYSSVADDKVSVSDQEITDKYNETKARYKQNEERRDIKLVSFNLTPSPQDFENAQAWINGLKEEFSTTEDIVGIVNSNSKPYSDMPVSARSIDPDLKNFAFGGKKGDVFGPMLFGNTLKMARIMETGISSPDSLKLKHIVVIAEDDNKTQTLADSILTALNGGADFAALAVKYSQMPQTAQSGGEIGWVPEASLVPDMLNTLNKQPLNKYFTYKDGQAIQIMQITEKTANVSKVKIAVIESEIIPSQETYGAVYNQAKQFAAGSRTLTDFEKNAQKDGYIILPFPALDANAPTLGAMKDSRQVIRWAFENEQGTVSDVYDCGGQFVVATVTAISPKGYRPIESVKAELKAELVVDKKAEFIASELKAKTASDLGVLASQIASSVDTAQVNFESSVFGKAGFEPEVIVAAVYSAPDKISEPVKGKQGVYVLKQIAQTPSINPFDVRIEKMMIANRYMYSVYGATQALKEKADIVDNRARFY
ncbi:MAG: SurA N-terminal domain-containing protein [Prevotellaceae bacterium]|jgi:peptidyl-prolyl cis-trans isomerase D|nr:SurA N-terminal domain-containing protein [Prevotellaceae bacterium]